MREHRPDYLAGPGTSRHHTGMRAIFLAVAVLAAEPAKAAGSGPEWDRLLACFNRNLATLVKSGEPIEVVFRGVRAICEDDIADSRAKMILDIRSDPSGPKTPRDDAQMVVYMTSRLDRALLAYAIKFKAVGGPTTLGE